MKNQVNYFWLAAATLGLLIIASAWAMGQETNLSSEGTNKTQSEEGQFPSDPDEASGRWEEFEEDDEFAEFEGREGRWPRENEVGFEDEDFEPENPDEDWDDFENEEEFEDEWEGEFEGDRERMVYEAEIDLLLKKADIAADSSRTAVLAVQLVGTYLDPEEATQLLEDSLEAAGNPLVKRLARMQLIDLYAQDEQTDQIKAHLKQLIQGF